MNIVLLSNHAWGTANRAGFHLLAESFAALGHRVTFVTTGLSFFSVLRRDARLKTGRPLNRLVAESARLESYLHFTPLHPHTLVVGLLNRLAAPFVRRYANYPLGAAEARLRAADVVFFESCSAVALVRRVKELAPLAKLVYRASDVITCMRSLPPEMERVEREVLPLFDLVSVPTATMLTRFAGARRVVHRPHGVAVEAYDSATKSPYPADGKRAVFVGMSDFDENFLRIAAASFKDVQFHVIGPLPQTVEAQNVVYHGRMPFAATVPYVKFADVALGTRRSSNLEILRSLGTSLKMLQYRHCALPIVMPEAIDAPWPEGCFRYRFDDAASIRAAFAAALASGRRPERANDAADWKTVAKGMLEDLCSS